MHAHKTATVFGGTGFIGRQIVRELAARGYVVKVATRIPESAYFLRPCGTVGQVVPFACAYDDPSSIARAIDGSDVVINCIGVLYERGGNTFERAHVDIPTSIAKACKVHAVKRFIHLSALSCDMSSSAYAQSKLKGEEAIRSVFSAVTIMRPSVVFGENDNFFNMFATLTSFVPVLPLIGGGRTKFQPVFVGDVADAVINSIQSSDTKGCVYQLGGPETVDFKSIYELIFLHTGRRRAMLPLPFALARMQAVLLNLFPTPLLTPDQVESLKTDNVVSDDALGLSDLGVVPTAMSLILPTYLERYRDGGRFAQHKAA